MKYARWLTLAALILVAVALIGCSLVRGTPDLELTADDDGTEQFVRVGQDLIITLESNQTTGYKWDLDGDLPSGLESERPVYTSESEAIGAGGTEKWVFHAVTPGEQGVVRLKYWRSFEETVPPIETFEVRVKVISD